LNLLLPTLVTHRRLQATPSLSRPLWHLIREDERACRKPTALCRFFSIGKANMVGGHPTEKPDRSVMLPPASTKAWPSFSCAQIGQRL
jgi:hypothetical protein